MPATRAATPGHQLPLAGWSDGRVHDADPPLAADLETLARELATGAAEVVRAGRASGFRVDAKSNDTDLVTEVDRASERWLVATIAGRRPGDRVLGEEGGDHGTDTAARVRWVIDPIDGTVNFVLGIPQFAVSVAAEVDGVVVAGAVANPASGEVFHGRRGGGSFLRAPGREPQRLTGPRRVPLDRAVLATGFGYDPAMRARHVALVAPLLPRIADIRRLGSAALDLCFLAAGRLDGYFEEGLNRWDHAAGGLIAEEAGCTVGGLFGAPASRDMLVAAGTDLAPQLTAALESLVTARDAG